MQVEQMLGSAIASCSCPRRQSSKEDSELHSLTARIELKEARTEKGGGTSEWPKQYLQQIDIKFLVTIDVTATNLANCY